eukprot:9212049-Ditylum_brightwellii.AAC.1
MAPLPPLLRRKSTSKSPKLKQKKQNTDSTSCNDMGNPNAPLVSSGSVREKIPVRYNGTMSATQSFRRAQGNDGYSVYSMSTGVPTHLSKSDETYQTDISSIRFGESVTSPPQHSIYGIHNQKYSDGRSPNCVSAQELNDALIFESAGNDDSFASFSVSSSVLRNGTMFPEDQSFGNASFATNSPGQQAVRASFFYPDNDTIDHHQQQQQQQQQQQDISDFESWRDKKPIPQSAAVQTANAALEAL